jgi:hypothetical protein
LLICIKDGWGNWLRRLRVILDRFSRLMQPVRVRFVLKLDLKFAANFAESMKRQSISEIPTVRAPSERDLSPAPLTAFALELRDDSRNSRLLLTCLASTI